MSRIQAASARPEILPDEVDLEMLRAMLESRGWRIYTDRLRVVEGQIDHELHTAEDWSAARLAQGQAKAMLTVKALPGILANEIKARAKKAQP